LIIYVSFVGRMNQEKLKQLQESVRIGGKGTARRKKKIVHRTATTDDKKLQSTLKKLSVSNPSFTKFQLALGQYQGSLTVLHPLVVPPQGL